MLTTTKEKVRVHPATPASLTWPSQTAEPCGLDTVRHNMGTVPRNHKADVAL